MIIIQAVYCLLKKEKHVLTNFSNLTFCWLQWFFKKVTELYKQAFSRFYPKYPLGAKDFAPPSPSFQ